MFTGTRFRFSGRERVVNHFPPPLGKAAARREMALPEEWRRGKSPTVFSACQGELQIVAGDDVGCILKEHAMDHIQGTLLAHDLPGSQVDDGLAARAPR